MTRPIHRQRKAARGTRLRFPQDNDWPKRAEHLQAFDERRVPPAG